MYKKVIMSLFLMFVINVSLVFAQEVVSVVPVQNALDISKSTNVSVKFDAEMNASTINEGTFVVHSQQKGLHTGTYSYNSGTNTAEFDPDNDFTVGDIVSIILTTGVEDATGNPLINPFEWSFTIEADAGAGEFAAKEDYGAGDWPFSVFSSDLDGDRYMDLAVANINSASISVLLNNGDGTFAAKVDYGAGNSPFSVFSADLDGDGDMDLAVANNGSNNVSVLLNNGDGTFAEKVDYGVGNYPTSVFSSDLDSDGDMDLATANIVSDSISVLLNNGDGTFAAKVDYGAGEGSRSVFSSDLDSDGDMDLAVANYSPSNNISVLLNNGDGTFAEKVEYGAGSAPALVFSSDLDSDGDMDLAVANELSDSVSVLLNNGDGTFAAEVEYGAGDDPISVFSSDLDSDGDMDLAVANYSSDNVSVLLNNGDGTFAEKVDYSTGSDPYSVFSSDLDSDGDIDLATANYGSSNVSVLRNIQPPPQVDSVNPVQNALNISKSTNISVTFDQVMNASTINDSTFIVYSSQTGLHSGTYSYDSETNTATFDPDIDFAVGEIGSVILTADIENIGGDSLTNPYGWSFTIEVDGGIGGFSTKVDYFVRADPWSVFSSDLDGDGYMDLAVVNHSSFDISVLLNNGDGTFTVNVPSVDYLVGEWPRSIFSSDLDSDGDMDLAVANRGSDDVSVLLNKGDGTFVGKVDYYAGNDPLSVFSSDLDGDGDLDLAVADSSSNNVSILLNSGDGTFAPKVDYVAGDGPTSVFSSDLDSDGDMDLAVTDGSSDSVSVLLNNGDGTFAAEMEYGVGDRPRSVFSSDLDADGDMDLAVANDWSDSVSVLLNNGDGTFAEKVDYSAGYGPVSVFSSDLDGDGDMDLATADGSCSVSILLNNGDGTFAEKVDYGMDNNPRSVFSSDLDGDGDMDLAVANHSSNDVSVLFNGISFITVTSPNGGEKWWKNSTYDITWISDNTSGNVAIEYSIDNGLNWAVIIASIPDTGAYSWLVPDTESDSCLVRITDTYGNPSDTSDAVFTILPMPFITVTSPNGGEEWWADSTCNITWTSLGTSGGVKLEYSTDNGSDWTEIIASMPDTGAYSWTIPNTPSDSCLVMITDTAGNPSDMSDAVFKIYLIVGVPELELPKVYSMSVNPLSIGNKLEVKYALPVKSSVKFNLYDIRGAKVKEIAEEKPAGYHSMKIDMQNSPKGVYFLKIEANEFTRTSKAVLM